ncbi:MAG: hypothetical protein LC777_11200 [Actinobacteria bacterium]|nr:hypothetical protein [Actinomycetota bacterium]
MTAVTVRVEDANRQAEEVWQRPRHTERTGEPHDRGAFARNVEQPRLRRHMGPARDPKACPVRDAVRVHRLAAADRRQRRERASDRKARRIDADLRRPAETVPSDLAEVAHEREATPHSRCLRAMQRARRRVRRRSLVGSSRAPRRLRSRSTLTARTRAELIAAISSRRTSGSRVSGKALTQKFWIPRRCP